MMPFCDYVWEREQQFCYCTI